MDESLWLELEICEGKLRVTQTARLLQLATTERTRPPIICCHFDFAGTENILHNLYMCERDPTDSAIYLNLLDLEHGKALIATHNSSSAYTIYNERVSQDMITSTTSKASVSNNTVFARRVVHRAISPFAAVHCVFAEDIIEAAKYIACWTSGNPVRFSIRPALIVVIKMFIGAGDTAVQLLQAVLRDFGCNHSDSFSSIRVLNDGKTRLSQKNLMRVLSNAIFAVEEERKQNNLVFNPLHHQEMINLAIAHACHEDTPFNFIKASRTYTPVSNSLAEHISNLIGAGGGDIFTTEVIASALAYDSFPEGMHRFPPWQVFEYLYSEPVQLAFENRYPSTWKQHLLTTRNMYEQFADSFDVQAAHFARLKALKNEWIGKECEETCFICLQSRPHIRLPCSHFCCETCIQGICQSTKNAWTFLLDECPLCGVPFDNYFINFKPPTAGTRILSIDGGGARAVIPLEMLRALQNSTGLPAIQDHFDLAIGTSSGAIVVAGLFANGWDITKCIKVFVNVADKVFSAKSTFLSVSLYKVALTILSLFKDSKYDSQMFEDLLQAAFGTRRSMDSSGPSRKFGVVATTIQNIPCIFGSYFGYAKRDFRGYNFIQPRTGKFFIKIWEALRCSSAAPWFFKPKLLQGLGAFQDGGLSHNNPVNLALCESDCIWPGSKLDFLLSLGTGTDIDLGKGGAPLQNQGIRSIRDRFVPRLFRSFMASLDGQRAWMDLLGRSSSEQAKKYHRLNIQLEGDQLDLDDASQIPTLAVHTKLQISQAELNEVSDALISSLFYFELKHHPVPVDQGLLCEGTISCRCTRPEDLFAIQRYLEARKLLFRIKGASVQQFSSGFIQLQYWASFIVPSKHSQFTINVSNEASHSSIGGSPFTLATLLEEQWPKLPFGSSRKRAIEDESQPRMTKRRKK